MISFRDKRLISKTNLTKLIRISKGSKMSFQEFDMTKRVQTRNWRRKNL